MRSGFNERTFEFLFNSEYCQINQALLATHPYIPSLNEEKDLGYDVRFELERGDFKKSVFLQHKISSYAEVKAGRNRRFFENHGGPYFRFPIDNEQHNTLCELARDRGNAYYCAPRFHLRHLLEHHYRNASVTESSALLNPLEVGDVDPADDEHHNVTYGPNGENPTLHSEQRRFQRAYSASGPNSPKLKEQRIDAEYVSSLSEEIVRRTRESKFRASVTAELERARPMQRAQFLLGHVYEVTWLLLP